VDGAVKIRRQEKRRPNYAEKASLDKWQAAGKFGT
jgi:hypothetical protein